MIKEKQHGFTLTETMVVVVVFTFVMSLSLVIFLGSIRVQRAALFQQRLVKEVSHALTMVEEEIRNDPDFDETDINKSYISSFVNSNSVIIDDVKTERTRERITVLVKSYIKIDKDRKIDLTLQTTATKR
jgi:prepilin-type N-terminal cleavage/methylation domain-containing protein